jgi:5'-nucleotidase
MADVLMHAYAESLIEGGKNDMFEKKQTEDKGEVAEGGKTTEKRGQCQGQGQQDQQARGQGLQAPKERAKNDIDSAREAKGGADAVIICGGTLRGDSQYGPGKITLGDILGE